MESVKRGKNNVLSWQTRGGKIFEDHTVGTCRDLLFKGLYYFLHLKSCLLGHCPMEQSF